MSLTLHLLSHLILSVIAGYISWKIFKKPLLSFFFAIAGGVAVDFDHLIDYFLALGWSFNLEYFLGGMQFLKSDKIFVLLHGWEYAIIFLAISFFLQNKALKASLFALGLGLFFHLGFDVVHNGIPVKSYFLGYRIAKNFEMKDLVSKNHFQEHVIKKKNSIFSE